jgi:hypothetical protein
LFHGAKSTLKIVCGSEVRTSVHLEPRFTDFPNLHLNLEVRFEEIVEPHLNLANYYESKNEHHIYPLFIILTGV